MNNCLLPFYKGKYGDIQKSLEEKVWMEFWIVDWLKEKEKGLAQKNKSVWQERELDF